MRSFCRPLIFDREITTNSPQRLHFTTTPPFSRRAVSRPQRQRTSLADKGTSSLSLISISHEDKGHSPFPTRTYERDRPHLFNGAPNLSNTTPCRLERAQRCSTRESPSPEPFCHDVLNVLVGFARRCHMSAVFCLALGITVAVIAWNVACVLPWRASRCGSPASIHQPIDYSRGMAPRQLCRRHRSHTIQSCVWSR